MKNILLTITLIILTFIQITVGCKSDFLDAKPNTSIIQPTSLDDYQGLLENYLVLLSPGLPIMSADEYNYLTYQSYLSRTPTARNAYIWEKDIFAGEIAGGDWSIPYQSIFYSNSTLKGLDKIKNTEQNISRLNFLKGWALFNRAFAYYELVSNFAPAYDENTSRTDLGVPIKLDPTVEDILSRSSVQQTYDQIISDLTIATRLLNSNLPASNRNRPSKIAAHALFARIYLSMRKYDVAELHADSSLQLYNKLIDYNTVNQTSIEPFTSTNDELIYWKMATNAYSNIRVNSNSSITITPLLLDSYAVNDLRPAVLFKKQANGASILKFMYTGSTGLSPFTGLATDEVYLIKSECAARRNDLTNALLFLNNLLIKRYKTGTFTSITASNPTDALNKIIIERGKELIWRGLRWSDLKRLNKEGANITLTRELDGKTYTLPPNDPKYVFPIPDNEITLSGIQQNLR